MPKCTIDGKEIEVPRGPPSSRRPRQRDRRPALLLAPRPCRGRQLPHVPGRDREDAQAPDRLQHGGHRGHGRADEAARRPQGPSARPSSSCSSTTRSTARSATRRASATCRTSTWSTASTTRRSSSRRRSSKRKVVDLGPIMLDAERCVLCSRCLRFEREVTGTNSFEFVNRGDHTQISTFEERPITHDYAGNLADVCPGGRAALPRLPLQDAGLVPEEHRLGLPGLLDGLQHQRRPSRRRGAAPPPAPQRRRQQVLDVRRGPGPLQADRRPRARLGRRALAQGGRVGGRRRSPPPSTRWPPGLKGAGQRRRVPGVAPGHQRGPLRVPDPGRRRGRPARLPRGRPAGQACASAPTTCSSARTATPTPRAAWISASGQGRRRRDPGGLRGRAGSRPRPAGARAAARCPEPWPALEKVPFIAVMATHEGPELARAHAVLPAALWAEVEGTFTNFQRRVQRIKKAVPPPGDARPRLGAGRRACCSASGGSLAAASAREVFALLDAGPWPTTRGSTTRPSARRGARCPSRRGAAAQEARA